MSIIAKAEESVTSSAPGVVEALGKLKFLLVVIPIICVIIGIVSQKVFEERNISTATFKLGTFATPQHPAPVPLAGENQMRSRMRAYAKEIAPQYPGALLLTFTVENDVIIVTATAQGEVVTNQFLNDVIHNEMNFQNGRLEKLRAVQDERKQSLETQFKELNEVIDNTLKFRGSVTEPLELLAIQHELDNARNRKAGISLELNTIAHLNTSDLFIDTTQIIQEPFEIASSDWYRPIVFGLAGLAVGLGITFLIAIVAVIRAFTKGRKNDDDEQQMATSSDAPEKLQTES